ncbi:unnamed protein product [Diamesa hyperborea]
MADNMKQEQNKLELIENEIQLLRKQMKNIKDGNLSEESEVLAKLLTENSKLKIRLETLNRAISDEKKNSKANQIPENEMISIRDHLVSVFTDAIASAYPELPNAPTVIALSTRAGDYQCNSALPICGLLKAQNIKQAPKDIAQKIYENVLPSPLISKMDVSPAGFINIFLEKAYAINAIESILKFGVKPPKVDKKRVVVDFSSPNIAKEMHVGHLRSTIIGESICRLLEYLGHDVLRINHVGDWGTQFGMLIAHLEDRFPKFLTESPPISDLQAFYKESKKRFDEEEDFKKRAYNRVVRLQKGEPDCIKAWNLICDVSRKEFQLIYNQLDVSIIERGESFYQSRMETIVKELAAQGLLEEDDGRKIMWGAEGDDYGGIPLTIIKSDGGFTYDTSDMATIKQRLQEEKADWIIYITDSGQQTHFKAIFSCAKRAGILDQEKTRIDHVGFGVVLGEDGKKFKTRSGDTVKLSDLLSEGLKRSMDKLIEKERDKKLSPEELIEAQRNVAFSCIKYADLSHNRTNEYTFSFDKMLDDKGNTAVYLLYAFTRIKSIARNCGAEFANNLPKLMKETPIVLDHEREWKLAKMLIQFPDVIARIIKDLNLHYLCEFVYEVCTTFTEFYDVCYCIEKNKQGEILKINTHRVMLCEATAAVMAQCFDILGLKSLQKI